MSNFWSSVREALKGARQDFTEVPIRRAILLLAVPMILEMSMESLFVVVDIFWVSRLGAEAVATVGLTEAMLTLIYTVAMGLMGASDQLSERGKGYTSVMLGGNATILLLFLGNAIFCGAGDAAIAMRVLWLANGLNILLGPCFIFGLGPFPQLGVKGAAIATNLGRGTGVVYLLYRLWRGGAHIRVERRHVGI